MLYSCTHMASVGVKGLMGESIIHTLNDIDDDDDASKLTRRSKRYSYAQLLLTVHETLVLSSPYYRVSPCRHDTYA